MLVTMKELLDKAQKENYAVIAVNVGNDTDAYAALEAAEEQRSPVILNVAYPAPRNLKEYGRTCEQLAGKFNVPVAVNLDHGGSFEECIESVAAGFTSMMADRSMLPYEENVEQVKLLTKIAHAAGMSIEAELGHVGEADNMGDGYTDLYTDPKQAEKYVQETGVDCLAVAIGTAHGKYPEGFEPKIDFERLEAIRKVVSVPLVLHGGSSSGDEQLAKCAKSGINKINIGTDNMLAGINAAEQHDQEFPYTWQYNYLEGFKKMVKHYMELFDSKDRA